MSRLPQVSGRECVKALEKVGFSLVRQRGSHMILCRDEPFNLVVVPDHQELAKGTLRAIIRDADLSVDEFLELL
ncbi:MAG: type II toxin-antitoxin system HicA family toxin [Potamolinea sp.]